MDRSVFVLLAGCTEISKVPGLTAAGASPELTFLTPVVDSEIIVAGKPKSMSDPPMTPDGIPTPAIITRSALVLTGMSRVVVNAGLDRKPRVPYIETGLKPAGDPRNGPALPDLDRAIESGKIIGETLSSIADHIYLAESIPGGTTTAYLIIRALGFNLQTSSSILEGADKIKEEIWNSSNGGRSSDRLVSPNNPLGVLKTYGDYMMALSLGISRGAQDSVVHYCGGTQMAVVYRLDRMVNNPSGRRDLITTSWIMNHRPDTIRTLVKGDILSANISFRDSQFEGLRKYDQGHVREGAGMGGAYYVASWHFPREIIMDSIASLYKSLSGPASVPQE